MLDVQSESLLFERLTKKEGFRSTPYKDIYGNWTLGFGWNINAMPMTLSQGQYMCREHIRYFDEELFKQLSFYETLDNVRKRVLIEMAFQLGVPNLLNFKKTLVLLDQRQWSKAADEMLNSDWGRTFKTRATELAVMIRTGVWS